MNVSGKVMVQEACSGGFVAHVYPDNISAAIQLLRSEIRRAADEEKVMFAIETEVADLLFVERKNLAEDGV